MSSAITLDQFRVLVAIAQAGSFSAAARELGRAQSAVTYAIQKLEDQIGVQVFDRREYRPVLTHAGRALLVRARRIIAEADAFNAEARGLAAGVEPLLSLVVDPMFPAAALFAALGLFRTRYPTLQTRVYSECLNAATRLVLDGDCTLGIVVALTATDPSLSIRPLGAVDLIMVAAPTHPLARAPAPLTRETFRDETQIVLTDRLSPGDSRDFSVLASQTWRVGDLNTKQAMLRAGLGFGSMPEHMVIDDIAAGRLVALKPPDWDGADRGPKLPLCAAWRTAEPPGPAGTWLMAQLAGGKDTQAEPTQSKRSGIP